MGIRIEAELYERIEVLENDVTELEDRISDLEGAIQDALSDLRTLEEVPLGQIETVVEAIVGQLREAL